ncbi:MAG: metalloregulator ArsR/SmtB family transcription factor [Candidatus Cellulosilyticum pullistercoris]|uniref:Metalloregulator ArsR/SmtB family transcription factor n=1 Tax=Candidatus Cellulosilyticum pullistercoris TaxID=2838521 RepID=A0A9E2KDH6_9FIRM|nr:metalloregulator ArsR/SmtB family transcription factor [Candidatus Cellulosilyticum pullistercoris]
MEKGYEKTAKVFKAFCDENRLMILEMLQSGERCACELLEELHIGQSTLSHHMKILCDSGIVRSRKEGKWTYYAINEEVTELAKKLLIQVTSVEAYPKVRLGKCE